MKREKFFRIFFYVLGLLVLAFGITLNTKTNLGVSPIISVAYSVSTILDANFGNVTLIWYIMFVFIEMVCHIYTKKYSILPADILQIPLSIVFTRFMNVFAEIIPDMNGSVFIRILFLMAAIVFTGAGIGFTLNVRLIPNPGDGIVQVIADCSKKKVGTVKNCFDTGCAIITVIISIIFAGKIIGIGIGTILAVIGVGRVVAVFNYFWKEKILSLSGIKA